MLCCLLAGILALAGVRFRRRQGDPRERRAGGLGPATWTGDGGSGRTCGDHTGIRDAEHRLTRVGLGLLCGGLGFEVVAELAGSIGGLSTRRPLLLYAGALLMTLLGVWCAHRGAVPANRQAWALFTLSASGGAVLAELADLHLLRLHTGPDLAASIGLHGLAVLLGLVSARLLFLAGGVVPDRRREPRTSTHRAHDPGGIKSPTAG